MGKEWGDLDNVLWLGELDPRRIILNQV
jgi:hypothetical protein